MRQELQRKGFFTYSNIKTLGKYPDNWKEIARKVKERAGWRCENCGKYHNPKERRTLTVHHIDRNPSNNEPWNLVALCQRCHLHIQSKFNAFQLVFSFLKLHPWAMRYIKHKLKEIEELKKEGGNHG